MPDAYAARGIAHVAQLDQTLHSAHSSDGPHGNSLRAATGMAAHRDLRVREPIIDQHHFLQSIQSCLVGTVRKCRQTGQSAANP